MTSFSSAMAQPAVYSVADQIINRLEKLQTTPSRHAVYYNEMDAVLETYSPQELLGALLQLIDKRSMSDDALADLGYIKVTPEHARAIYDLRRVIETAQDLMCRPRIYIQDESNLETKEKAENLPAPDPKLGICSACGRELDAHGLCPDL